MGREFELQLEVINTTKDEAEDIVKAARDVWPFTPIGLDDMEGRATLEASGKSELADTENDIDVANQVAMSIWAKKDKFIPLTIRSAYLGEPPFDAINYDEDRYKFLTGK